MADENKKDVRETEKAPKAEGKEKAKDKSGNKSKDKSGDKFKSKAKKPNPFVKAFKGIVKFFKDFKGEMKKIVWPDSKTVLKNSGVVIATVILIGVGIWIVDFGLSELLKFIKRFADDAQTTTEAATQAVNLISSLIK